jgi:hypothetical protein
MNRRSFVGSLFAAFAGFFGLNKEATAKDWRSITSFSPSSFGKPRAIPSGRKYDPEEFKRVFRHDGDSWKEIEWENMKPNDSIIYIGIKDGELGELTAFVAGEFVPESVEVGGIRIQWMKNLAPEGWKSIGF